MSQKITIFDMDDLSNHINNSIPLSWDDIDFQNPTLIKYIIDSNFNDDNKYQELFNEENIDLLHNRVLDELSYPVSDWFFNSISKEITSLFFDYKNPNKLNIPEGDSIYLDFQYAIYNDEDLYPKSFEQAKQLVPFKIGIDEQHQQSDLKIINSKNLVLLAYLIDSYDFTDIEKEIITSNFLDLLDDDDHLNQIVYDDENRNYFVEYFELLLNNYPNEFLNQVNNDQFDFLISIESFESIITESLFDIEYPTFHEIKHIIDLISNNENEIIDMQKQKMINCLYQNNLDLILKNAINEEKDWIKQNIINSSVLSFSDESLMDEHQKKLYNDIVKHYNKDNKTVVKINKKRIC